MNRRTMLTGMLAFASVLALSSSCWLRTDCDYTERRCKTVCDWQCGGPPGYGCFFSCHDVCWDECFAYDHPPAPRPIDGGDLTDAGPTPADDGGLALCAPCQSNDECGSGGLCIHPGGDGGTPFCGRACTDSCPAGFVCSAIGTSRQCLPASGACP